MKLISIRLTIEDSEKLGTGILLYHDQSLIIPNEVMTDFQLEMYAIKKITQLMQFDKSVFNVKRYRLNQVNENYYVVPREFQQQES